MAKRGRPASTLTITDHERVELLAHLAAHKGPADEKLRIRIVLGCADGEPGPALAHRLKTTIQTVSKWRRRYQTYRFAGLSDAPRSGRPRTVQDAHVQSILDKVSQSAPTDAAHWSVRAMAKETGVSAPTVQRIWHAFGLRPHLRETFNPFIDPYVLDRVRDVVGLYMAPPDRALVLCADEMSLQRPRNRMQPSLPVTTGKPAALAGDRLRYGAASLFTALDTAAGRVIAQPRRWHRSAEFLQFLNTIDALVPAGQHIHLIMDNYGIHKTEKLRTWLAAHPRYHVHLTPTSASWLNLIEHFFCRFSQNLLEHHPRISVDDLEQSIRGYIERPHMNAKPFVWHRSTDVLLASATLTAAEFS